MSKRCAISKDRPPQEGSVVAKVAEQAREAERAAIARELHDTVIQPLAALVTSLESFVSHPVAPSVAEAYVAAWGELAREAIVSLRCALSGLRANPYAQLGLPEALQRYLVPQARAQGVRLILESRDWAADLPADWTSSLYLLVREALTNVQKHARATEATILLHADAARLSIVIADNGVGFCVEQAETAHADGRWTGFGIVGMRERVSLLGGELALVSAPGQGTRVEIAAPRPCVESDPVPTAAVSTMDRSADIHEASSVFVH